MVVFLKKEYFNYKSFLMFSKLMLPFINVVVIVLLIYEVIPQFEEVFNSFGASLPATTDSFINYKLYIYTVPWLISIASLRYNLNSFFTKKYNKKIIYNIYFINKVVLFLTTGVTVFVMYLPITILGPEIS